MPAPNLKFAGDVTIASAVAGSPAVFSDVTVSGVTNLNFENIDFIATPGGTSGDPVTITQSRGITVNNATFDGHQVGGIQNGLLVSASSDIQISNSELADFYFGAGFRIVDNLRLLNNDVHSMDFDGLRLAQVTNTLIQGNRLHDMDGTTDGDHRDMIQFWTTETSAPSANVTIRDNVHRRRRRPVDPVAVHLQRGGLAVRRRRRDVLPEPRSSRTTRSRAPTRTASPSARRAA